MLHPNDARVSRRGLLTTLAAATTLAATGRALAACQPPIVAPAPPVATRAAALPLGLLLPSEPALAPALTSLTYGLELFLEEAGWRVGDRPLALVKATTRDGEVAAARELIAQPELALLLGAVRPEAADAVMAAAHEARVPCLLADSGGRDLRRERPGPYVFRTGPSNWQLNQPFGDWLYYNVSRRLYLSATDTGWGRESVAALRRGFAHAGVAVVSESYLPLGTRDFRDELRRIGLARADCVYACYAGADAAAFIAQYAAAGLNREARLAGPGSLAAEDLLATQGEAALGLISSQDWTLARDAPEAERFRRAYRERHGQEPDALAARGHDTGRIAVEALRQAGWDVSNRARLLDALTAVRFDGPRGPVRFDGETRRLVLDVYVRDVKRERGTLTNVVLETIRGVRDPVRIAEGG
jgi:branched-chain amino acid transport system substrate-binding protein